MHQAQAGMEPPLHRNDYMLVSVWGDFWFNDK